jgi:hypothetical protein
MPGAQGFVLRLVRNKTLQMEYTLLDQPEEQSFVLRGLDPLEPHEEETTRVSQLISSKELETFPTITKFQAKRFTLFFLVCFTLLPVYVLVTLAKEHRAAPAERRQASARRKLCTVLFSLVYSILLLVMLIGFALSQVSAYEIGVALLLHTCACAVECLVRCITVVPPPCKHLEDVPLVLADRETTVQNLSNQLLSAQTLPTSLMSLCLVASALSSAVFGAIPMVMRLEFSGFALCSALVNATLCFVSLSVVGKTLLQLHRRVQVAQEFRQLTSNSENYLDLAHSWANVIGWMSLRTYLISRSRQTQTRVASEIVLSAAFVVLIPLWMSLLAQLFLEEINELTVLSFFICLSLGLFLLIAVSRASQVQKLYRDTMPLKTAQLRALDKQSTTLCKQLKTLDRILSLQEEGILFVVFGVPLNERAVMWMLGYIATVISTGISKIL